jgi:hypothetical protein
MAGRACEHDDAVIAADLVAVGEMIGYGCIDSARVAVLFARMDASQGGRRS